MNEAETKIVKQFIELAEDKYDDVKIYWADVRGSHEYTALKALVEDKPEDDCSMCYQREAEFEGVICPRCGKSNDIVEEPKKPKKQTLLEYVIEKQPLIKTSSFTESRFIFDLISEYLENKEN